MTYMVAGRECYLGCDVSRWQGDINWHVFNLDFVVYKATGGDAGLYTDGRFFQNAAGFDSIEGAYHFASKCQFDPRAEADYFCDKLLASSWASLPSHKKLPPTLDWEPTGGKIPNSAAWCLAFLRQVWARTGIKPMIYTAGWCNPIGSAADMAELATYDFWLAAYASNPDNYPCPPWGTNWSAWQYSSTGSVVGISGNCDMDAFRVDRLNAILGAGQGVIPTQPVQPSSEDEDMKTIIAIETKVGHYIYDPLAGTGRVITPEEETFLISEGWTVKQYPAGSPEHVLLNEKATKLNYPQVD